MDMVTLVVVIPVSDGVDNQLSYDIKRVNLLFYTLHSRNGTLSWSMVTNKNLSLFELLNQVSRDLLLYERIRKSRTREAHCKN